MIFGLSLLRFKLTVDEAQTTNTNNSVDFKVSAKLQLCQTRKISGYFQLSFFSLKCINIFLSKKHRALSAMLCKMALTSTTSLSNTDSSQGNLMIVFISVSCLLSHYHEGISLAACYRFQTLNWNISECRGVWIFGHSHYTKLTMYVTYSSSLLCISPF